jgi:putative oxidoreductase
VGIIFLFEGIQKFLFPATCGLGRFAQIGISRTLCIGPFRRRGGNCFWLFHYHRISNSFVRHSLLIDISVAIVLTKIPILLNKGFWAMAHEAGTDYAMFMGLVLLLVAGGGEYSRNRY